MPVIRCDEASNPPSANPDAVWVPAADGDRLYYYNVDSCVAVTLVCANGLVGGHAGQVSPATGLLSPAANLAGVIGRMAAAAPAATAGELRQIWYVGTTGDAGWDLAAATRLIWDEYGGEDEVFGEYVSESPVDVVFDTATGDYTVLAHVRDQTAAGVVAGGTPTPYA